MRISEELRQIRNSVEFVVMKNGSDYLGNKHSGYFVEMTRIHHDGDCEKYLAFQYPGMILPDPYTLLHYVVDNPKLKHMFSTYEEFVIKDSLTEWSDDRQ